MLAYTVRRLLLIIPTLVGVMIVNLLIVQAAPGGPVDQIVARIEGTATGGEGGGGRAYRGAEGVPKDVVAELNRQFGFDRPLHERFLSMMADYLRFDFGNSYFRKKPVIDLIVEKLPVSISLGLWTTLLAYAISIPLGISKAVKDGTRFDSATSMIVIVGYAIPAFMLGVILIVFFAGGTFVKWFPLRNLTSDNWETLSLWGKVVDYFWHMTLPLLALAIGSFATLTLLTKNSFLDQIRQQYVLTARAKGLTERRVLYGHVFRNGMLVVVAGFPAALIGILFTSAFLIEVIFSLDGLGRLGFEATLKRDYAVVFATLYIFTLIGLVVNLVSDLTYVAVDPRIDFEKRKV